MASVIIRGGGEAVTNGVVIFGSVGKLSCGNRGGGGFHYQVLTVILEGDGDGTGENVIKYFYCHNSS